MQPEMAISVLFSVNEMREIAQHFEDEGMPGTIGTEFHCCPVLLRWQEI